MIYLSVMQDGRIDVKVEIAMKIFCDQTHIRSHWFNIEENSLGHIISQHAVLDFEKKE